MTRGVIRSGWVVLILIINAIMVRSERVSSSPRTICEIQGVGAVSPFEGEAVTVMGVVTADFDDSSAKGFYIQHQNCDGADSSSDGIFVYLSERGDIVQSGDRISVSGVVNEYFGFTEIEAISTTISIVSRGNPLPPPVELNPPSSNSAAKAYFESVEAMYVHLDSATVVGPTNKNDEIWVVRSDIGVSRVFRDDPAGSGLVICVDEDGFFEITPEVQVGDQITGLRGVIEYSYGLYRFQLLTAPTVIPGVLPDPPTSVSPDGLITIATLNLENLFDPTDDLSTEDDVSTVTAYQRKLEKLARIIHDELAEPLILAVQEAENVTVLADLISRPEIKADYNFVLIDGPDIRGIDVAILYQPPQVTLVAALQKQGCTALVDGLGPDGNKNVKFPANGITCDLDRDGVLDGNRLFSRPPLLAEFAVKIGQESRQFFVVSNHWKSKGQDTATKEYTLPRRKAQAEFVAGLATDVLGSNPEAKLVVLGDFNDYVDSQPLSILSQSGLTNLIPNVDKPHRYTYIYQGISQVLDHIFVSSALSAKPTTITIPHINADYPYKYHGEPTSARRSSDHDPVWVGFAFEDMGKKSNVYLPLILNNPATPYTKLVISEVMYDVNDEPEEEWIELYNAGRTTLDLPAYKIGDEETPGGAEGMLKFPVGAQIISKGIAIIANEGVAFRNIYGFNPDFEIHDTDVAIPDMDVYSAWGSRNMQLGNSGDEVLLLAADDAVLDAVSWGNSKFAFDPSAKDVAEGHSLERFPAFSDRSNAEIWRDQTQPNPGGVDVSVPPPTPTPTPSPTPTPTPEPTPLPPVVINEIHADPAGDLSGDANGDGVRDGADDEFIEIVNTTNFPVDLSGWTLKDRVNVRHVFLNRTIIQPGGGLVVFGGGQPGDNFGNCEVQVSTKGGLGLNNSGDTVTLYDLRTRIVAAVIYSSQANADQSITRSPDIFGDFRKHSTTPNSGGAIFSPGTKGDGTKFSGCSN
jgi:hypothetical protein